jgi:hypothetical protein
VLFVVAVCEALRLGQASALVSIAHSAAPATP